MDPLDGSASQQVQFHGLYRVKMDAFLWDSYIKPLKEKKDAGSIGIFRYLLNRVSYVIYGGMKMGVKKLREALHIISGSRLLSIQDFDQIQPVEPRSHDVRPWVRGNLGSLLTEYDKAFPSTLQKNLGVDLVIVRSKELRQEVVKADINKAEEIAHKWISDAEDVIEVTKNDIVMSARWYLAFKSLMGRYNANAITTSSWAFFRPQYRYGDEESMHGKSDAMPCLAEMELAKDLIPCCCENLVDCIITEMLGIYIYGRPGFVGDMIIPSEEKFHFVSEERDSWIDEIDFSNNMILFGHCYGPINPHGNDKVPYVIRSHVRQKGQNEQCEDEHVTLVGIQAQWPIDETVTVAKTDVYNRKIAVFTGKTVDGNLFYKEFDNRLCRTKIAVKVNDVKSLIRNLDPSFGIHRVVFCGDYRQRVRDLAELAGFEVVEEDTFAQGKN